MSVTRRQFLQQIGVALATWGVSETVLWTLRDRYQQVLAAPTRRKLALLIGINQYPFNAMLEGCVTDVELQRELLIYRFGFQPSDVLTLTDAQATRAAVETAFVEHLIQPAKAGDVVVVHFSGFGSTVAGDATSALRPSLVMADGAPTGDAPQVNDWLLETLGLLLRSLKTDQVTTLLDTSYTYPGQPLQGNLRVRAYPNPSTATPNDAELDLQATLLSQLKLSRDRQAALSPFEALPGTVLAATGLNQVATEVRWNHFSAGLFTQRLTQSLWHATPASTITICLHQVAQEVGAIVSQQQPTLQGQALGAKRSDDQLAPYFLPLAAGADGAIAALEDDGTTVQLWLGGLPAALLEQYGVNSLLTVVLPEADPPVTLQIVSRDSFTAKAKVCCGAESPPASVTSLAVGQFVREAVRVLPRHVGLTVALDGSLERIERVDAISAFTAVPRVSLAIAGEQPADFLFSKVQAPPTQVAALPSAALTSLAATPATISYGLFSPGRDALLSTTGEGGEAIKVAVKRLVPKLQTLLATKLLNLSINDQASQLAIRAQLEQITPQAQLLATQVTPQTTRPAAYAKAQPRSAPNVQLPLGSRIRFRVENQDTYSLYFLAIALDTASNLLWLQVPTLEPEPTAAETATSSTAIAPDTARILPASVAGAEWQIQGTSGLADTYLILSRTPFSQTLTTLLNQQRTGSSAIAGTVITNPLEVVQSILQDLHQATTQPSLAPLPDAYALDVNNWATLRFTYQVG